MTKHSSSVKEALNDWDYRTGYSMDESIEALIAEIEDLEDQLAEMEECLTETEDSIEGMKEGCAQRIQEAETQTEKFRDFVNQWLGWTVAGVSANRRELLPWLISAARELNLTVPENFEVDECP